MNNQLLHFNYLGLERERLDKFLVDCLPEYSRSRLQGLIRSGFVNVNGKVVTKTGYFIEHQQIVEVQLKTPKPSKLIPEPIPLDIIFENGDLLVVNKPAGMVVHPSAGHLTGTLIHAVLAHTQEIEGVGAERRPGVVHRLDKDTSGLVLFAKNDRMHRWLQNQFKMRKVKKTYLALVDGQPPTPKGRIEAPIGRDPSHRKRMAVVPSHRGREAYTEYFSQKEYSEHTLLRVHPLTGRTHQIRIHMAFIGCPIVGDILYGRRHPTLPINRHFLHARRLAINLSSESQQRIFETPLASDLEDILSHLR